MRKALFYFGLGSLVVGSYFYYRRQLEMLENISYRVVGIKVVEVQPLKLLINTEVTNNSEIAFTIKGYDIKVFINGKEVGKVFNDKLDQKLNGFGGKSNISFYTSFNPDVVGIGEGGLGSLLSGVLNTLGDTKISFKGKVSVKRGFFEFANYPVDFTYNLTDFL